MGSEPDDDDVRSFGSEPDFAAMSSLRISSGTDAGPSPNGGHVFDELLDEPPRPFDHDLREAEATSLQALLDRFEELLRRDGGEGDEDDDGGERRREETERDPSRRPRRVRSDRQNDMVPVAELARRWRRVGFVPAPGSRRRASITPSIGVQWVPAPPETRAGQPRRRDPHAAAAAADDDDDDEPASSSSPWIEAMRGAAGEWWCDAEKAPGFFTVTGRGYGKTRIDARGRGRSTNDDEGGEEDGDASGEDELMRRSRTPSQCTQLCSDGRGRRIRRETMAPRRAVPGPGDCHRPRPRVRAGRGMRRGGGTPARMGRRCRRFGRR